jgi:hypothetical protein
MDLGRARDTKVDERKAHGSVLNCLLDELVRIELFDFLAMSVTLAVHCTRRAGDSGGDHVRFLDLPLRAEIRKPRGHGGRRASPPRRRAHPARYRRAGRSRRVGQDVIRSVPRLFYKWRAIEKLAEGKTADEVGRYHRHIGPAHLDLGAYGPFGRFQVPQSQSPIIEGRHGAASVI